MAEGELETIAVSRRGDTPVLYVQKRCEFTRIIVTLSRNRELWLTSLGWRPEEKSIALKCDNTDHGLAISIPRKHARDIRPADSIEISCQELGFEGSMVWGTAVAAAPSKSAKSKSIGATSASSVSAPDLTATAPAAAVAKTTLISTEDNPEDEGSGKKGMILAGIAGAAILTIGGITVMAMGSGDDALNPDTKTRTAENKAGGVKTASNPGGKDKPLTSTLNEDERIAAKNAETEARKIEAERKIQEHIQTKKDEEEAKNRAAQDKIDKAVKDKADAEKAEANRLAKIKSDKDRAEREKAAKAKAEKDAIAKAAADKKADIKRQARENAEREEAKRLQAEADAAASANAPSSPNLSTPDTASPDNVLSATQITQLQKDLSTMGYYTGPADGTLSETTRSAIDIFKTIFEIPTSAAMDRKFLRTVSSERKKYESAQDILDYEAAPTTVETAPVLTEPVVSAPAPEVSEPVASTPALEPAPSQNTRYTKPNITDRKAPVYPDRPLNRSSFDETVTVVVGFSVSTEGTPKNIKIDSNSHTGRYLDDFNDAALTVARSLRFDPALNGDVPVEADGETIKLIFKK